MSKRAFKDYIANLPRKELQSQLLDLYERFPPVKTYYDFIFNPREEALVGEAKARIRKEYFPEGRRKPKARRSVAHRYIKHFRSLEMEAAWVAELMLYNLETAQAFEAGRNMPTAFYKSMLNSFEEMLHYVCMNRLLPEYCERIEKIYHKVQKQGWPFAESFSRAMESAGKQA